MKFIRRNFLFMLTGRGKGAFNIFVGTLLFNDTTHLPSILMGAAMIFAGCIFIFLTSVRNISDDELDRAVSVTR